MVLESMETIYFNDGSGWKVVFTDQRSSSSAGLTGFVGGALVQYSAPGCGIQTISDGVRTCSDAASAHSVSTVTKDLAYASDGNRVYRYDGQLWTQWGPPLALLPDSFAYSIWGSSNTVLVGANSGQVYVYPTADPNEPVLQPGLPVANNLAVWGLGPDDLWVGNSDGQLLHFDGNSWAPVWSATGDCRAIVGLWGADGTLYFITESSIGRWQSGNVQMLAQYPCGGSIQVQSLWGNSASEVFFALTDSSSTSGACARVRVSWFNGAQLSPL